jgi:hypothetical protein
VGHYYPFTRRRRWSTERQMRDRERRRKAGAHIRNYVVDPWTQEQTLLLVAEEQALLRYLQNGRTFRPLWELLEELVGEQGSEKKKRPVRQMWLALINRLISERKLVRYRKHNKVGLAGDLRC